MTQARRLLPLAAITVALGAALLVAPGAASTWVHVYLLLVAAGVLLATVRAFVHRRGPAMPSIVDPALTRRQQRASRPEDLELLERLVSIGSASAFDLHYRLRPALRTIAEGVLLGRGIDLETQPERAQVALGDAAWSLLRPDRLPPEDRQARALATGDLDAVVRGIESAR